ncbi:hypothetical protein B4U79_07410 [Dinothrombium tinctorium]|uniref:G-protein coupled receptors family 1 profile domain-containing protein n=1 Tax=Dinothrombium tinctorium TaxID=1965070 RepID=A0A443Q5U7_9ACAR|nr:hypothetical protein B4U79_06763 [Dinothrombium tinctorium]RWS02567.1 hypothetical protein B4U79_07410 [Dinothrombium tinctorium]
MEQSAAEESESVSQTNGKEVIIKREVCGNYEQSLITNEEQLNTPNTSKSKLNPTITAINKTSSNANTGRESIEAKRERKAAKTLTIITGVFLICWLPFFINALLMPICGDMCNPGNIVIILLLWLGWVNSTLNPIIYTIFSPDFRAAFNRIILNRKPNTRPTKV